VRFSSLLFLRHLSSTPKEYISGVTSPRLFSWFVLRVVIFLHSSCFIGFGDPIFSDPDRIAVPFSASDRTSSFLVLNLTFSTDTGKNA
jgi:hypothetical protein